MASVEPALGSDHDAGGPSFVFLPGSLVDIIRLNEAVQVLSFGPPTTGSHLGAIRAPAEHAWRVVSEFLDHDEPVFRQLALAGVELGLPTLQHTLVEPQLRLNVAHQLCDIAMGDEAIDLRLRAIVLVAQLYRVMVEMYSSEDTRRYDDVVQDIAQAIYTHQATSTGNDSHHASSSNDKVHETPPGVSLPLGLNPFIFGHPQSSHRVVGTGSGSSLSRGLPRNNSVREPPVLLTTSGRHEYGGRSSTTNLEQMIDWDPYDTALEDGDSRSSARPSGLIQHQVASPDSFSDDLKLRLVLEIRAAEIVFSLFRQVFENFSPNPSPVPNSNAAPNGIARGKLLIARVHAVHAVSYYLSANPRTCPLAAPSVRAYIHSIFSAALATTTTPEPLVAAILTALAEQVPHTSANELSIRSHYSALVRVLIQRLKLFPAATLNDAPSRHDESDQRDGQHEADKDAHLPNLVKEGVGESWLYAPTEQFLLGESSKSPVSSATVLSTQAKELASQSSSPNASGSGLPSRKRVGYQSTTSLHLPIGEAEISRSTRRMLAEAVSRFVSEWFPLPSDRILLAFPHPLLLTGYALRRRNFLARRGVRSLEELRSKLSPEIELFESGYLETTEEDRVVEAFDSHAQSMAGRPLQYQSFQTSDISQAAMTWVAVNSSHSDMGSATQLISTLLGDALLGLNIHIPRSLTSAAFYLTQLRQAQFDNMMKAEESIMPMPFFSLSKTFADVTRLAWRSATSPQYTSLLRQDMPVWQVLSSATSRVLRTFQRWEHQLTAPVSYLNLSQSNMQLSRNERHPAARFLATWIGSIPKPALGGKQGKRSDMPMLDIDLTEVGVRNALAAAWPHDVSETWASLIFSGQSPQEKDSPVIPWGGKQTLSQIQFDQAKTRVPGVKEYLRDLETLGAAGSPDIWFLAGENEHIVHLRNSSTHPQYFAVQVCPSSHFSVYPTIGCVPASGSVSLVVRIKRSPLDAPTAISGHLRLRTLTGFPLQRISLTGWSGPQLRVLTPAISFGKCPIAQVRVMRVYVQNLTPSGMTVLAALRRNSITSRARLRGSHWAFTSGLLHSTPTTDLRHSSLDSELDPDSAEVDDARQDADAMDDDRLPTDAVRFVIVNPALFVPAGKQAAFEVHFHSLDETDVYESLVIKAPGSEQYVIPISASGGQPLKVLDSELDFDYIPAGKSKTLHVRLQNLDTSQPLPVIFSQERRESTALPDSLDATGAEVFASPVFWAESVQLSVPDLVIPPGTTVSHPITLDTSSLPMDQVGSTLNVNLIAYTPTISAPTPISSSSVLLLPTNYKSGGSASATTSDLENGDSEAADASMLDSGQSSYYPIVANPQYMKLPLSSIRVRAQVGPLITCGWSPIIYIPPIPIGRVGRVALPLRVHSGRPLRIRLTGFVTGDTSAGAPGVWAHALELVQSAVADRATRVTSQSALELGGVFFEPDLASQPYLRMAPTRMSPSSNASGQTSEGEWSPFAGIRAAPPGSKITLKQLLTNANLPAYNVPPYSTCLIHIWFVLPSTQPSDELSIHSTSFKVEVLDTPYNFHSERMSQISASRAQAPKAPGFHRPLVGAAELEVPKSDVHVSEGYGPYLLVATTFPMSQTKKLNPLQQAGQLSAPLQLRRLNASAQRLLFSASVTYAQGSEKASRENRTLSSLTLLAGASAKRAEAMVISPTHVPDLTQSLPKALVSELITYGTNILPLPALHARATLSPVGDAAEMLATSAKLQKPSLSLSPALDLNPSASSTSGATTTSFDPVDRETLLDTPLGEVPNSISSKTARIALPSRVWITRGQARTISVKNLSIESRLSCEVVLSKPFVFANTRPEVLPLAPGDSASLTITLDETLILESHIAALIPGANSGSASAQAIKSLSSASAAASVRYLQGESGTQQPAQHEGRNNRSGVESTTTSAAAPSALALAAQQQSQYEASLTLLRLDPYQVYPSAGCVYRGFLAVYDDQGAPAICEIFGLLGACILAPLPPIVALPHTLPKRRIFVDFPVRNLTDLRLTIDAFFTSKSLDFNQGSLATGHGSKLSAASNSGDVFESKSPSGYFAIRGPRSIGPFESVSYTISFMATTFGVYEEPLHLVYVAPSPPVGTSISAQGASSPQAQVAFKESNTGSQNARDICMFYKGLLRVDASGGRVEITPDVLLFDDVEVQDPKSSVSSQSRTTPEEGSEDDISRPLSVVVSNPLNHALMATISCAPIATVSTRQAFTNHDASASALSMPTLQINSSIFEKASRGQAKRGASRAQRPTPQTPLASPLSPMRVQGGDEIATAPAAVPEHDYAFDLQAAIATSDLARRLDQATLVALLLRLNVRLFTNAYSAVGAGWSGATSLNDTWASSLNPFFTLIPHVGAYEMQTRLTDRGHFGASGSSDFGRDRIAMEVSDVDQNLIRRKETSDWLIPSGIRSLSPQLRAQLPRRAILPPRDFVILAINPQESRFRGVSYNRVLVSTGPSSTPLSMIVSSLVDLRSPPATAVDVIAVSGKCELTSNFGPPLYSGPPLSASIRSLLIRRAAEMKSAARRTVPVTGAIPLGRITRRRLVIANTGDLPIQLAGLIGSLKFFPAQGASVVRPGKENQPADQGNQQEFSHEELPDSPNFAWTLAPNTSSDGSVLATSIQGNALSTLSVHELVRLRVNTIAQMQGPESYAYLQGELNKEVTAVAFADVASQIQTQLNASPDLPSTGKDLVTDADFEAELDLSVLLNSMVLSPEGSFVPSTAGESLSTPFSDTSATFNTFAVPNTRLKLPTGFTSLADDPNQFASAYLSSLYTTMQEEFGSGVVANAPGLAKIPFSRIQELSSRLATLSGSSLVTKASALDKSMASAPHHASSSIITGQGSFAALVQDASNETVHPAMATVPDYDEVDFQRALRISALGPIGVTLLNEESAVVDDAQNELLRTRRNPFEILQREMDLTQQALFPLELPPGASLSLYLWFSAPSQPGLLCPSIRLLQVPRPRKVEYEHDLELATKEFQFLSRTQQLDQTQKKRPNSVEDKNSGFEAKLNKIRTHYSNKKERIKSKILKEHLWSFRFLAVPLVQPVTSVDPSEPETAPYKPIIVNAGPVLSKSPQRVNIILYNPIRMESQGRESGNESDDGIDLRSKQSHASAPNSSLRLPYSIRIVNATLLDMATGKQIPLAVAKDHHDASSQKFGTKALMASSFNPAPMKALLEGHASESHSVPFASGSTEEQMALRKQLRHLRHAALNEYLFTVLDIPSATGQVVAGKFRPVPAYVTFPRPGLALCATIGVSTAGAGEHYMAIVAHSSLALLSAHLNPSPIAQPKPSIITAPTVLDFGCIGLNSQKTLKLTVINHGGLSCRFRLQPSVSDPGADSVQSSRNFIIEPSQGIIPAGSATILRVTFTPSEIKRTQAHVELHWKSMQRRYLGVPSASSKSSYLDIGDLQDRAETQEETANQPSGDQDFSFSRIPIIMSGSGGSAELSVTIPDQRVLFLAAALRSVALAPKSLELIGQVARDSVDLSRSAMNTTPVQRTLDTDATSSSLSSKGAGLSTSNSLAATRVALASLQKTLPVPARPGLPPLLSLTCALISRTPKVFEYSAGTIAEGQPNLIHLPLINSGQAEGELYVELSGDAAGYTVPATRTNGLTIPPGCYDVLTLICTPPSLHYHANRTIATADIDRTAPQGEDAIQGLDLNVHVGFHGQANSRQSIRIVAGIAAPAIYIRTPQDGTHEIDFGTCSSGISQTRSFDLVNSGALDAYYRVSLYSSHLHGPETRLPLRNGRWKSITITPCMGKLTARSTQRIVVEWNPKAKLEDLSVSLGIEPLFQVSPSDLLLYGLNVSSSQDTRQSPGISGPIGVDRSHQMQRVALKFLAALEAGRLDFPGLQEELISAVAGSQTTSDKDAQAESAQEARLLLEAIFGGVADATTLARFWEKELLMNSISPVVQSVDEILSGEWTLNADATSQDSNAQSNGMKSSLDAASSVDIDMLVASEFGPVTSMIEADRRHKLMTVQSLSDAGGHSFTAAANISPFEVTVRKQLLATWALVRRSARAVIARFPPIYSSLKGVAGTQNLEFLVPQRVIDFGRCSVGSVFLQKLPFMNTGNVAFTPSIEPDMDSEFWKDTFSDSKSMPGPNPEDYEPPLLQLLSTSLAAPRTMASPTQQSLPGLTRMQRFLQKLRRLGVYVNLTLLPDTDNNPVRRTAATSQQHHSRHASNRSIDLTQARPLEGPTHEGASIDFPKDIFTPTTKLALPVVSCHPNRRAVLEVYFVPTHESSFSIPIELALLGGRRYKLNIRAASAEAKLSIFKTPTLPFADWVRVPISTSKLAPMGLTFTAETTDKAKALVSLAHARAAGAAASNPQAGSGHASESGAQSGSGMKADPVVSMDVPVLDFGLRAAAEAHALTIYLSNTGSVRSNFVISGDFPREFSVNPMSGTVLPKSMVPLTVAYEPSSATSSAFILKIITHNSISGLRAKLNQAWKDVHGIPHIISPGSPSNNKNRGADQILHLDEDLSSLHVLIKGTGGLGEPGVYFPSDSDALVGLGKSSGEGSAPATSASSTLSLPSSQPSQGFANDNVMSRMNINFNVVGCGSVVEKYFCLYNRGSVAFKFRLECDSPNFGIGRAARLQQLPIESFVTDARDMGTHVPSPMNASNIAALVSSSSLTATAAAAAAATSISHPGAIVAIKDSPLDLALSRLLRSLNIYDLRTKSIASLVANHFSQTPRHGDLSATDSNGSPAIPPGFAWATPTSGYQGSKDISESTQSSSLSGIDIDESVLREGGHALLELLERTKTSPSGAVVSQNLSSSLRAANPQPPSFSSALGAPMPESAFRTGEASMLNHRNFLLSELTEEALYNEIYDIPLRKVLSAYAPSGKTPEAEVSPHSDAQRAVTTTVIEGELQAFTALPLFIRAKVMALRAYSCELKLYCSTLTAAALSGAAERSSLTSRLLKPSAMDNLSIPRLRIHASAAGGAARILQTGSLALGVVGTEHVYTREITLVNMGETACPITFHWLLDKPLSAFLPGAPVADRRLGSAGSGRSTQLSKTYLYRHVVIFPTKTGKPKPAATQISIEVVEDPQKSGASQSSARPNSRPDVTSDTTSAPSRMNRSRQNSASSLPSLSRTNSTHKPTATTVHRSRSIRSIRSALTLAQLRWISAGRLIVKLIRLYKSTYPSAAVDPLLGSSTPHTTNPMSSAGSGALPAPRKPEIASKGLLNSLHHLRRAGVALSEAAGRAVRRSEALADDGLNVPLATLLDLARSFGIQLLNVQGTGLQHGQSSKALQASGTGSSSERSLVAGGALPQGSGQPTEGLGSIVKTIMRGAGLPSAKQVIYADLDDGDDSLGRDRPRLTVSTSSATLFPKQAMKFTVEVNIPIEGSFNAILLVVPSVPGVSSRAIPLTAYANKIYLSLKDSSPLEFGCVALGEARFIDRVLVNAGHSPAEFSISHKNPQIVVSPMSGVIPPRSTVTLSISFLPTDTTPQTDPIVINSPAAPSLILPLNACGGVPRLRMKPARKLDFGKSVSGRVKRMSILITNTGTAAAPGLVCKLENTLGFEMGEPRVWLRLHAKAVEKNGAGASEILTLQHSLNISDDDQSGVHPALLAFPDGRDVPEDEDLAHDVANEAEDEVDVDSLAILRPGHLALSSAHSIANKASGQGKGPAVITGSTRNLNQRMHIAKLSTGDGRLTDSSQSSAKLGAAARVRSEAELVERFAPIQIEEGRWLGWPLLAGTERFSLPVGHTLELPIEFTPTREINYSGRVLISLGSPQMPSGDSSGQGARSSSALSFITQQSHTIEISGMGQEALMLCEPNQIEFSRCVVNGTYTAESTLTNLGDSPCSIEIVQCDPDTVTLREDDVDDDPESIDSLPLEDEDAEFGDVDPDSFDPLSASSESPPPLTNGSEAGETQKSVVTDDSHVNEANAAGVTDVEALRYKLLQKKRKLKRQKLRMQANAASKFAVLPASILSHHPGKIQLAPRERARVLIRFRPPVPMRGVAGLHIVSPFASSVIRILLDAGTARLRIPNNIIDMGIVERGSLATASARLENTGSLDLQYSLTLVRAVFDLETSEALPNAPPAIEHKSEDDSVKMPSVIPDDLDPNIIPGPETQALVEQALAAATRPRVMKRLILDREQLASARLQLSLSRWSGAISSRSYLNITAKFTPTFIGNFTIELAVSNDTTGEQSRLYLRGSSQEAVLATAPLENVDFGDRSVGETAQLVVPLVNIGKFPLTYKLHGNYPLTIPKAQGLVSPLSVAYVPIHWTPVGRSTLKANLSVNSNSGAFQLQLKGTASFPTLSVSTSSLAFGLSPIGKERMLTFKLYNPGRVPSPWRLHSPSGAVQLIDSHIPMHHIEPLPNISPNCAWAATPISGILQPDESIVVSVFFRPLRLGVFNSTLTVESKGRFSEIQLSGSAGSRKLDIPAEVEVGKLAPGQWQRVQIPISNSGLVPAVLLSSLNDLSLVASEQTRHQYNADEDGDLDPEDIALMGLLIGSARRKALIGTIRGWLRQKLSRETVSSAEVEKPRSDRSNNPSPTQNATPNVLDSNSYHMIDPLLALPNDKTHGLANVSAIMYPPAWLPMMVSRPDDDPRFDTTGNGASAFIQPLSSGVPPSKKVYAPSSRVSTPATKDLHSLARIQQLNNLLLAEEAAEALDKSALSTSSDEVVDSTEQVRARGNSFLKLSAKVKRRLAQSNLTRDDLIAARPWQTVSKVASTEISSTEASLFKSTQGGMFMGFQNWVLNRIKSGLTTEEVLRHAYYDDAISSPSLEEIFAGKTASAHPLVYEYRDVRTNSSGLIATSIMPQNPLSVSSTAERRKASTRRSTALNGPKFITRLLQLTSPNQVSEDDLFSTQRLFETSLWIYPESLYTPVEAGGHANMSFLIYVPALLANTTKSFAVPIHVLSESGDTTQVVLRGSITTIQLSHFAHSLLAADTFRLSLALAAPPPLSKRLTHLVEAIARSRSDQIKCENTREIQACQMEEELIVRKAVAGCLDSIITSIEVAFAVNTASASSRSRSSQASDEGHYDVVEHNGRGSQTQLAGLIAHGVGVAAELVLSPTAVLEQVVTLTLGTPAASQYATLLLTASSMRWMRAESSSMLPELFVDSQSGIRIDGYEVLTLAATEMGQLLRERATASKLRRKAIQHWLRKSGLETLRAGAPVSVSLVGIVDVPHTVWLPNLVPIRRSPKPVFDEKQDGVHISEAVSSPRSFLMSVAPLVGGYETDPAPERLVSDPHSTLSPSLYYALGADFGSPLRIKMRDFTFPSPSLSARSSAVTPRDATNSMQWDIALVLGNTSIGRLPPLPLRCLARSRLMAQGIDTQALCTHQHDQDASMQTRDSEVLKLETQISTWNELGGDVMTSAPMSSLWSTQSASGAAPLAHAQPRTLRRRVIDTTPGIVTLGVGVLEALRTLLSKRNSGSTKHPYQDIQTVSTCAESQTLIAVTVAAEGLAHPRLRSQSKLEVDRLVAGSYVIPSPALCGRNLAQLCPPSVVFVPTANDLEFATDRDNSHDPSSATHENDEIRSSASSAQSSYSPVPPALDVLSHDEDLVVSSILYRPPNPVTPSIAHLLRPVLPESRFTGATTFATLNNSIMHVLQPAPAIIEGVNPLDPLDW